MDSAKGPATTACRTAKTSWISDHNSERELTPSHVLTCYYSSRPFLKAVRYSMQ